MAQFPSTESASGIWSLKKQKRAEQGDNWPTMVDPFFEYVSLLLPGNGTNGAQNNTFLDSSVNSYTITRSLSSTQGTFTPYGSNWSNYLDGTGDSIQSVSSSLWTWTTATSWTIEAFVFPLTRASVQPIYGAFAGSPGSGTNNGELLIETTGQVTFRYWNGAEQKVTTSGTVPLNTWNHVVMAFDGTNIAIYINGTRSANTARNGTPDSTTNTLYLGTTRFGTSGDTQIYFTGYISNARVVRNSVVYSGATISVPTAPLTVVTGTQLLTCADNRFIDDSSNNFAITRNGDVSVQRFSPFNPTAPYDSTVLGGSMFAPSTGGGVDIPTAAGISGTGAFTVEVWVYLTATVTNDFVLYGSSINDGFYFYFRANTNSLRLTRYNQVDTLTVSNPVNLFSWNHLVCCRDAGRTSIFINGSRVATTTTSLSFASPTNLFSFGNSGYLSNLRVSNSAAFYDPAATSITVPTSPVTAITNTRVLLNYTNGGIIDNAMMNDLETVGNAQISTSVSRFGGGSLAFDGTGDYLVSNAPTTNLYAFGSGDFTVEFWYYSNNTGSQQIIYDSRPSGTNGAYMVVYKQSGNVMAIYVDNAVRITGTTSLAASTWYHIAVSRSGTSTRLFVNGVQEGSTFTDTYSYLNGSNRPVIGTDGASLGGSALNGNIDDLRVTRGFARYTANFTPPGPLPLC